MNIPPELLERFKRYEITSAELSRLTGYHAVSLRRAIERKRPPKPASQKYALRVAREAFRKSIAHLPVKEVVKRANVSISTAYRIKELYGTGRPVTTR